MGFFDWLSSSKNEPYFISGVNGKKWTPSELGEMIVLTAIPPSAMLVDVIFSGEKLDCKLPLTIPVLSDPFPASLYFIAFSISWSILFSESLEPPSNVKMEIQKGITNALLNIKKPDGSTLNNNEVAQVNEQIKGYCDSIIIEIQAGKPITQAVTMLLSIILFHYNNRGVAGEKAVDNLIADGLLSPNYAETASYLLNIQNGPFQALSSLNITYHNQ